MVLFSRRVSTPLPAQFKAVLFKLMLVSLLCLGAGGGLQAGILVLKNGKKIYTKGPYQLKGNVIHYKDKDGTLFVLPAKLVDLEASSHDDHDFQAEREKKIQASLERQRQEENAAQAGKSKMWNNLVKDAQDNHIEGVDEVVVTRQSVSKHTRMGRENKVRWEEVPELWLLHTSIRDRDDRGVRKALQEPIPLDGPMFGDRPPLLSAIQRDFPAAVELLLEAGAKPDVVHPEAGLPVALAISLPHLKHTETIIRTLISYGAYIDARNPEGMTALHYALIRRNDSLFNYLISQEANPNLDFAQGEYPLFITIAQNDADKFATLLERRADTNILSKEDGYTPLQAVIQMDSLPLFKVCEQKNYRIPDPENLDLTPFTYAVQQARPNIFKYLLENNSYATTTINKALHIATKAGNIAFMEVLLKNNGDPNYKHRGRPLLSTASEQGELAAVMILVEAGADVYAKGPSGLTAHATAGGEKRMEIRAYLQSQFQKN